MARRPNAAVGVVCPRCGMLAARIIGRSESLPVIYLQCEDCGRTSVAPSGEQAYSSDNRVDKYIPDTNSADAATRSGVGAARPFPTHSVSPSRSNTSVAPTTSNIIPAATGSQNPLSTDNHRGLCGR